MDYMTLSKFPATVCLYKAGLRCIVFTTAMQVCSSTACMQVIHKQFHVDSFRYNAHCYDSALYLETASTGQPQFAGVVTSLGPKAESTEAKAGLARPTSAQDLQVGDRVLGACRFGSYATQLNVPAQQVKPSLALLHNHSTSKTHNMMCSSQFGLCNSSHACHCKWGTATCIQDPLYNTIGGIRCSVLACHCMQGSNPHHVLKQILLHCKVWSHKCDKLNLICNACSRMSSIPC